MKGVFVTGSNTGVGKTTVAIEIVRHISKTRAVKVRKPVETNCELSEQSYIPKDAIALSAACQLQEPLNKVCPYCFEIEASAELASTDSSEKLTLEDLVLACKCDVDENFVLVEGAGGLYSPIAEAALNVDLANELQLPLLIVIRDELGAISQALLTLEAAKKNKLTVACVVLNVVKSNNLSNKEALTAYTETPVVSFSQGDLDAFCSEIEKLV
ncbi:MAG TPA: dethiobiotin synthase [Gammaproteobacteria bacterium]|jgi:dethiobiotin synthetase|nr:dethiobiotin synthase [Gammaproteobacteria bacterium]